MNTQSHVVKIRETVTHYLTLVDGAGYEHRIPLEFCTSFQVLLSSVLGDFSHCILSSNLIRLSKFYLRATRLRLALRHSMCNKDSTTCILMGGRVLILMNGKCLKEEQGFS